VNLPIIDIHTQLMPERILRQEQEWLRADYWHPRTTGAAETLAHQLVEVGIGAYVLGPYATHDGAAESLNHWTANACLALEPRAIGFATFHPDDYASQPRLLKQAFDQLQLKGVKLYPARGAFALDDPRLEPIYKTAEERELPVLLHAGRRPGGGTGVGGRLLGRVLRSYPNLNVVAAYLGADEFEEMFDLCTFHEGLHLETAMVLNRHLGGPPSLERIIEWQDRILFGSGFPNIPFGLTAAIEAVRDLGLGRAMEEKIFTTNAARVMRLDLDRLSAEPDTD
jgi:predicted TIM-barrel fold metal-dependent hydrolase